MTLPARQYHAWTQKLELISSVLVTCGQLNHAAAGHITSMIRPSFQTVLRPSARPASCTTAENAACVPTPLLGSQLTRRHRAGLCSGATPGPKSRLLPAAVACESAVARHCYRLRQAFPFPPASCRSTGANPTQQNVATSPPGFASTPLQMHALGWCPGRQTAVGLRARRHTEAARRMIQTVYRERCEHVRAPVNSNDFRVALEPSAATPCLSKRLSAPHQKKTHSKTQFLKAPSVRQPGMHALQAHSDSSYRTSPVQ